MTGTMEVGDWGSRGRNGNVGELINNSLIKIYNK